MKANFALRQKKAKVPGEIKKKKKRVNHTLYFCIKL